MKKLIICIFLFFCCVNIFSQPPLPRHGTTNNAADKEGCIVEIDEKGNIKKEPITTATSLLLTLAIGGLAYKIKKNRSDL